MATTAIASGGARTVAERTIEQVNAGLDGCDHEDIDRHIGDGKGGRQGMPVWECRDCGQEFGPIFFETPMRP